MSCSSLKRSGMARVNELSHRFACHPHVYPQVKWTIPAFTAQPQSITTLWLALISRPAEGRRLSWPRRLGEILRWFICQTVTHPSTNWARRRVTSLICQTMLPLRHAATMHSQLSLVLVLSISVSTGYWHHTTCIKRVQRSFPSGVR